MNYASHYDRLILRARQRVLAGYGERHHVMPRCMGGSDVPVNLVVLTPEEHYVAHQLLVKMHPLNLRLAHAAIMMAQRCSGSRAYGWLRRRNAAAMLGNKRSESRPVSERTRAKLSAAMKGKQNFLGKTHSAEARAKVSDAMRGKQHYLGKRRSPETLARLAAANLGKRHTDETKAKISQAKAGVSLSPEHRAKISAGLRGLTLSAETRAKISAARKARHAGEPS